MYRLGDFYELFFEDALVASRELEIVLTGRDCGLPQRAPMCGVPFHALQGYLDKLVKKGYKVAICEQLSDPAAVQGPRGSRRNPRRDAGHRHRSQQPQRNRQ